ncbi:MAG: LemA family protein [Candidatus Bathyarchaeia archaeon]
MKTKIVIVAVALIAVIAVAGYAALYFSTYNNLVSLDVSVDESWAQVEQELQRRYDLIPNVVTAAKAYMTYEGSVLENVTRLRDQWNNAVAGGNVDEIDSATGALESGVSQLIVTFEAYPDLKASSIVQSLIIELEGTENRISTERMRYNEAVGSYNTAIKVFPANLWANGWGFESKAFFEAELDAYTAPQVNL